MSCKQTMEERGVLSFFLIFSENEKRVIFIVIRNSKRSFEVEISSCWADILSILYILISRSSTSRFVIKLVDLPSKSFLGKKCCGNFT